MSDDLQYKGVNHFLIPQQTVAIPNTIVSSLEDTNLELELNLSDFAVDGITPQSIAITSYSLFLAATTGSISYVFFGAEAPDSTNPFEYSITRDGKIVFRTKQMVNNADLYHEFDEVEYNIDDSDVSGLFRGYKDYKKAGVIYPKLINADDVLTLKGANSGLSSTATHWKFNYIAYFKANKFQ